MKELCDQSSTQMGLFHPNEVGRIAQHARKGEGKKEGKDGVVPCDHLQTISRHVVKVPC